MMQPIAIVLLCLAASLSGGCQNKRSAARGSLDVVSQMAAAAAKGDFASGIAIGEHYLRDNPEDTNVLQQTAILMLAQAKQDQVNREQLVARAIPLIERSLKSAHSQNNMEQFTDAFTAARSFESAADLSSDKCPLYKRAITLNKDAAMSLTGEVAKLRDGSEVPTKPLRDQSRRLQSELEKRISESRCGEKGDSQRGCRK